MPKIAEAYFIEAGVVKLLLEVPKEEEMTTPTNRYRRDVSRHHKFLRDQGRKNRTTGKTGKCS